MDGRFNGTVQNVVGQTLVAMAPKFGLGTEIQSPTGLLYLFVGWLMVCSLTLGHRLQWQVGDGCYSGRHCACLVEIAPNERLFLVGTGIYASDLPCVIA